MAIPYEKDKALCSPTRALEKGKETSDEEESFLTDSDNFILVLVEPENYYYLWQDETWPRVDTLGATLLANQYHYRYLINWPGVADERVPRSLQLAETKGPRLNLRSPNRHWAMSECAPTTKDQYDT
jgi:hypothetical protein